MGPINTNIRLPGCGECTVIRKAAVQFVLIPFFLLAVNFAFLVGLFR
jgi:hypothetical protein